MSAFQPGDVVVCVDDRGPRNEPTETPTGWIVRGNHYRVEKCIDHVLGAGVKISGVAVNRFDWFYADRFRKIDDEVTEEFREQLRAIKSPAPCFDHSEPHCFWCQADTLDHKQDPSVQSPRAESRRAFLPPVGARRQTSEAPR